jgi:hypothetical protein
VIGWIGKEENLPRIGADERGSGNCQKSPQMPKIVEIEKQDLEPQEAKEHGGQKPRAKSCLVTIIFTRSRLFANY